jgi:hypothetical protein
MRYETQPEKATVRCCSENLIGFDQHSRLQHNIVIAAGVFLHTKGDYAGMPMSITPEAETLVYVLVPVIATQVSLYSTAQYCMYLLFTI